MSNGYRFSGKGNTSVGTPSAAAEEASVANTTSAPLRKPSMGASVEAESSSTMGWYIEIGLCSS